MNAADQKLFDAMLSGKFNIQDKTAFEERLVADAAFKSDWELYQSMDNFLEVKTKNEDALAALRDVHAQNVGSENSSSHEQVEQKESKVVEMKSSRRPWMIAASTIIVLSLASYLAMSLFLKPKWADYAGSYEEPTWPIERGAETQLSKVIAEFVSAPKQEGINKLHGIADLDPAQKKYWLAEMHLKAGAIDSCLYYIPQAAGYGLKKDRLKFVEALAYLKTKDATALQQLLESLPRDFDPYYRQKMEIFLQ